MDLSEAIRSCSWVGSIIPLFNSCIRGSTFSHVLYSWHIILLLSRYFLHKLSLGLPHGAAVLEFWTGPINYLLENVLIERLFYLRTTLGPFLFKAHMYIHDRFRAPTAPSLTTNGVLGAYFA